MLFPVFGNCDLNTVLPEDMRRIYWTNGDGGEVCPR